jgi:predicted outer membrane protein
LGRLAAKKGKSAGVKAFGQRMVRDHSKAFQDKADNASDSDLKSFVPKTLPTLLEHQRLAKEIKGKQ